jgi:hypothetical protein
VSFDEVEKAVAKLRGGCSHRRLTGSVCKACTRETIVEDAAEI